MIFVGFGNNITVFLGLLYYRRAPIGATLSSGITTRTTVYSIQYETFCHCTRRPLAYLWRIVIF